MKNWQNIGIISLAIFVCIQFVPSARNKSEKVPESDFMNVYEVPLGIRSKLKNSCYDCHSNSTEYPSYSKVQPIAWFLERHISNGKEKLNFNEWALLSSRRKTSKLRSIIKQIENNEMPLDSYTLIHREAILSEKEAQEIIDYMQKLKNNLQLN